MQVQPLREIEDEEQLLDVKMESKKFQALGHPFIQEIRESFTTSSNSHHMVKIDLGGPSLREKIVARAHPDDNDETISEVTFFTEQ